MQPALAGSAFAAFPDELLAYFSLFGEPRDLLRLGQANSVFYVFCQEEPLWMAQSLRLHAGDFSFLHSWKLTTFFPREPRPEGLAARFRTFSPSRGFASDFLYRRWYRAHMALGDAFALPARDPTIKRVHTFDARELSFRAFYEQYSKVPFILRGAIDTWRASTEWTMEKLVARFPSDVKHRITHNLDIVSAHATMEMSFADYWQYMQRQHDETPLYIFDARFGDKMPSMLGDYSADALRLFRQDYLRDAAETQAEAEAKAQAESVRFQAGGKKVGAHGEDKKHKKEKKERKKRDKHGAIRPDFRWLVIGPERTGAPWHTDPARTSAWNALVKGRKRWAIYPPDSPPPGAHATSMTSLMWYLHVYPTLPPEHKPWEVVQEEGDTIFVPSGWWHLVLNLDATIAVTHNFVDAHNLLAFANDLVGDNQDEALVALQHQLQPTHPETYDVFRLAQIPRAQGYVSQDVYMRSFKAVEYWKAPVQKVFARHQLERLWSPELGARTGGGKLLTERRAIPRLKSLTARANPTFAVGKRALVKFFSQFNEDWGEFDLEAFLAPNFEQTDSAAASDGVSEASRGRKRQKRAAMDSCELKRAMSLRYAMEECFRVEKAAYAMISRDAEAARLVPAMYHAGHLLHVDEVDDEDGDGPMWRWPYIVLELKHGLVGLGAAAKKGGASRATWLRAAAWIGGELLPKLHAVPIDRALRGLQGHFKCEWDWYLHYLLRQRQRALAIHWRDSTLPARLAASLDAFLPEASPEAIRAAMLPAVASSHGPVLLHGDLTDENVLGRVVSRSKRPPRAQPTGSDAVRALLQSIGCEKYAPVLVEREELTVATLALLDAAALQELGIPLGPRLAILQATKDQARGEESDGSDEWETASSSSSSSDSDGDEAPATSAASGREQLQEKRQARFYGAVEWEPACVVDFADAKTGDPLYDLVAVLFSALHCDRALWEETLATDYWQAYIAQERTEATAAATATARQTRRCLRERLLQLVLLHPSRSVKGLFHYFPSVDLAASWEELARVVFGELLD